MKIGIMGGTFDPIHNGHLMLGHAAYETFSLDQIWFMPNGNPPHKKSETIKSTAEDRMKMTSLAIAPFPEFVLQPYEALREEVSCSYQTMEYFKEMYPEDEFYFIIGADSLMAIETWVHPERIFPTCTILATYRDEIKTKEEMDQQIHHLSEKYGAQVLLMETPLMPVSSHELRASLQAGESVSACSGCCVRLYKGTPVIPVTALKKHVKKQKRKTMMDEKILKIQHTLKKELDENRYHHTLGVMYTSASMAMRYDVDVQKALYAGLLHDCAKCIPSDKKIRLCEKYGLPVSSVEKENPSLLHARLGAYLAHEKYGVKDEEIIYAIESHTTGRPGMSMLEKIVYIADYIEPGRRELPNMADVRQLAFRDIDECLYRILKDSLVYLDSKNITVDPMTQRTYDYYKKEMGKED